MQVVINNNWIPQEIVELQSRIATFKYKTSISNDWIVGYIVSNTTSANKLTIRVRCFIQGRVIYQNTEYLNGLRFYDSDDNIIFNVDVNLLFSDYLVPMEVDLTFTQTIS